jgi:hypothetical protein
MVDGRNTKASLISFSPLNLSGLIKSTISARAYYYSEEGRGGNKGEENITNSSLLFSASLRNSASLRTPSPIEILEKEEGVSIWKDRGGSWQKKRGERVCLDLLNEIHQFYTMYQPILSLVEPTLSGEKSITER